MLNLYIYVDDFEIQLLPLISRIERCRKCSLCGSFKIRALRLVILLHSLKISKIDYENKDQYLHAQIAAQLLSKVVEFGVPDHVTDHTLKAWSKKNAKYSVDFLERYYENFVLLKVKKVIFKTCTSCACF